MRKLSIAIICLGFGLAGCVQVEPTTQEESEEQQLDRDSWLVESTSDLYDAWGVKTWTVKPTGLTGWVATGESASGKIVVARDNTETLSWLVSTTAGVVSQDRITAAGDVKKSNPERGFPLVAYLQSDVDYVQQDRGDEVAYANPVCMLAVYTPCMITLTAACGLGVVGCYATCTALTAGSGVIACGAVCGAGGAACVSGMHGVCEDFAEWVCPES